ncbi:KICSTOR complex protein ITFG2-like isoform X1 [Sipha flava]|uniref:KICSTOR complex protein ITFG2-like isoform X1 n=1 Tax=Sipha flava TaxID=143950 RepID=A0A8B8FXZ0_9HEMI|nr:KICSTOR complex protein ITFG2-like isoform X1 [Sipha flava]
MNIATFVDHFDFELPGNVFKSAVALGDVDNDNDIELVVGNMEGDLYIFKGQRQIQKISGLGIITAIAIGDLMNCGSNTLIVISGDGWCHIYLCLKLSKSETTDECIVKLEPVHVQRIPANTKVLLLGDIDADGMLELIVGLTDRVIRSYRWSQSAAAGRLVPLHKWECGNQIGSIIMIKDINGRPCLLVSQPGVTALRIYCPIAFPELMFEKIIDYENEFNLELRNPSISSEMIGNIKIDKSKDDVNDINDNFYAIATSDGLLMLAKQESIIWSKNIEHEVFYLNKLSITESGSDFLIACSWNGETFIIDQKKQVSTFKLGEPITAFCSGMYTARSNTKPVSCFVFITISHKVCIYFDMKLPNTCTESLTKCIENDNQLSKLINNYEGPLRKKLINTCLYRFNHNDS